MNKKFFSAQLLLLTFSIGMPFFIIPSQSALDTTIDKTAETSYAYGPAISLALGVCAAKDAKNIISGVFRFSGGLLIGILLQEIAHQYLKSRSIRHNATRILYNKKILYNSCDSQCKIIGDTLLSRAYKQTEFKLQNFIKDVSKQSHEGIQSLKNCMNTKPDSDLKIKKG